MKVIGQEWVIYLISKIRKFKRFPKFKPKPMSYLVPNLDAD